MSHTRMKRLRDYWDCGKFGSTFIRELLNYNRFMLIYSSIHLVDEEKAAESGKSDRKSTAYDSNYKISE